MSDSANSVEKAMDEYRRLVAPPPLCMNAMSSVEVRTLMSELARIRLSFGGVFLDAGEDLKALAEAERWVGSGL